MGYVIGIIALFVIVYMFIYKSGDKIFKKLRVAVDQTYKSNNFSPTKEQLNPIMREGIAFDQNKNQLMFLKQKEFNYEYDVQIIPIHKILESKIIENGETVTRTSRTSQVTGIAVGTLLAGGIGAIVGGLSGKTMSSKSIKEIQLELIIDDVNDPITRMQFYYDANGIKQNSDRYKTEYEKVYYWHKLIEVLMHQHKSQTI
jgi:hypothetical protein